jgi:hypothetical protein
VIADQHVGREHNLTGNIEETNFAAIEHVGQTLAITAELRVRYIGRDVIPGRPEDIHNDLPFIEFVDFLNGNEIEAGDDLGDVEERVGQALAVTTPIDLAEIANVPGCEEQIVFDVLVRQRRIELLNERDQSLPGKIPHRTVTDEPL